MSPLFIQIALHYYAHGDDYRDGDFSAPAVRAAIDWFIDEGLIEPAPHNTTMPVAYVATERLNFYVNHLMAQPLPVQRWAMPENSGKVPCVSS